MNTVDSIAVVLGGGIVFKLILDCLFAKKKEPETNTSYALTAENALRLSKGLDQEPATEEDIEDLLSEIRNKSLCGYTSIWVPRNSNAAQVTLLREMGYDVTVHQEAGQDVMHISWSKCEW